MATFGSPLLGCRKQVDAEILQVTCTLRELVTCQISTRSGVLGVRTGTPKTAILGSHRAGIEKLKIFVQQKIGLCRLPSPYLTLSIDLGAHFRPGRAFSSLSMKI